MGGGAGGRLEAKGKSSRWEREERDWKKRGEAGRGKRKKR